jgi:hypothetical protein
MKTMIMDKETICPKRNKYVPDGRAKNLSEIKVCAGEAYGQCKNAKGIFLILKSLWRNLRKTKKSVTTKQFFGVFAEGN